MLAKKIRSFIIFVLRATSKLEPILIRAEFTAIGFSGHVSEVDKSIARQNNFKDLNRFEKWILNPTIEAEKEKRKENFRQAVIEVTGEDPEIDWTE